MSEKPPLDWRPDKLQGITRALRMVPGWQDDDSGLQGMIFEFVVRRGNKTAVFSFDTNWGPMGHFWNLRPFSNVSLMIHRRSWDRDWPCEYVDGFCGDLEPHFEEAADLLGSFLTHGESVIWPALAEHV